MGFHESYWVVLGTAAPVIALTYGLALQASFRALGWALQSHAPRFHQRMRNRALRVVYFVSGAALLLEGCVFGLALWNLASRRDRLTFVSGWIAFWPLPLVILVYIVLATVAIDRDLGPPQPKPPMWVELRAGGRRTDGQRS